MIHPTMVQFQGKHGRMPTKENSETIVCQLFDCKLTAKGEEAHVRVKGDPYTYQVTQATYLKIRGFMEAKSDVLAC